MSGSNPISTPLARWFRSARLALPIALALAITCLARANNAPIPFSEIGGKATVDYQGEALGITATPDGARLRCGFQKLEGRATAQGLWLESSAPGGGEFCLVATTVDREVLECGSPLPLWIEAAPSKSGSGLPQSTTLSRWCPRLAMPSEGELPTTGTVSVEDRLARFTRPGVTEEYSVSVDGVRQDFVITERPAGAGDLRVELALTGGRAEAADYGAKVILETSGRALAYSRLRASDAKGQELRARLEVLSAGRLALRVADANATYPVRIDPTFSDANWVSLNPGLPGANGTVSAIAVDGSGNVYVGGYFTVIGNVAANSIAKWSGSAWSALGSGMSGVSALAVSGTNLYAGGSFTTAGGVSATNIAKWNGSAWSALGTGIDSDVYALAVNGTNLYAGGGFTNAGGVTANCIAKWDGSTWSALGSGMGGFYRQVYALAVSGTTLYAGGGFTNAGGMRANYIAKWNGSAWSALGAGMDSEVYALAVSGTTLYAGGYFETAGGVSANYIAKWNGSAWSAMGTGMDDAVEALAVSGTTLYAGGYFTTAGGVAANYIAKWNGSAWSAWSADAWMNASVSALAVNGTTLYAGGGFTTAGGLPANYIAKWNGSVWSAIGTGMNGGVDALAVSGTTLYAGGYFTRAGGVAATNIAKWNGTNWSALGSGIDGDVYALAVNGTTLYAGGWFFIAGGVAANYIAKWNGSAWSALGQDPNGPVRALAVSGTDLYAAGGEWGSPCIGSMQFGFVAEWDGSAWSQLGEVMDLPVVALAVNGTELYAGGYFRTAGEVSASYIAKWNGTAWSALGSGMDSAVNALAADGSGHLFVGGSFSLAGTNVSPFIAQANLGGVPLRAVIQGIRVSGGTVMLDCQGSPGSAYSVQRATDVQMAQNLATLLTTNAPSNGLFRYTDANPPTTAAFYRLLQQ